MNTGEIFVKSAGEFADEKEFLSQVVRVEEEAWPEEIRAIRDKFVLRLQTFPQGFLAIFIDGRMAGVSTSEIIQYDSGNVPTTWEVITDNGYITKTHKKDGNALYIVSLGVSGWAQGKGLGSKLIEAQKELVKKLNLSFLVLGARLPGYRGFHHKNPDISAEDYLMMKNEKGEPQDPEIRFYERNGLRPVRLVKNYMKDDPESENYGVVMAWKNNEADN